MHAKWLITVFALLFISGCASNISSPAASSIPTPTKVSAFEVVPKNKDSDLRIFNVDGSVTTGVAALEKMVGAKLVLWLAGNQFFAMEDVVHAFQRMSPEVGSVAVITLPPGLLLNAIQRGGWTYQGKDYPMQPDIYASVDLGHLKKLKAVNRMDRYIVYLHNEMELIVAKGNPKNIRGIEDLGRSDVRSMLPNPIDEGIMTFYGKPVLQRHGLWEKLTAGKECKSCQATPNTYFTAVHHREIPEALKAGTTDVGIVWVTETKNELGTGSEVVSVPLPAEDSMVREVAYVIGTMTNAKNASAAQRYMDFLKTNEAQAAYAKFGFIKASPAELSPRAIP